MDHLHFKLWTATLLSLMSGISEAAVPRPTLVDFGQKLAGIDTVVKVSAYYGKANAEPDGSSNCYYNDCVEQNGVIVGTILDGTSAGSHLHRSGTNINRTMAYHGDAGGIYMRINDDSSFSLDSLRIITPYSIENPYAKFLADGITPNPDHDANADYFEILGFDQAFNSNLWSGDGTNVESRVAYQTVYNGFNGILDLNDQFRDVDAIWIHYANMPNTGSVKWDFKMEIDDILVSAPQTTAVPLPPAFWLFGSVMAYSGFCKRKSRSMPIKNT